MNTRIAIRRQLLIGAALGALTVTAAHAQDRAEQQAAATNTTGLEEIIVTATKRETNLQETPIAISVIDPTIIADRHVQSLINLADGAIPSLRIATFEARQSALTVGIRGIVPFDANQTARDQGVGVYIDGIYLGRQQGLNAALFDVQRIEVLRGPQGTLFGRNTEGGAVSIVTRRPTGEFGGRASIGYGNYGSYDGQMHFDLPSVANVAVKIDGVIQHQDATTTNPLAGEFGWNYFNRAGARVSALWEPVDTFSALVTYDMAKDQNTPFYSQLVDYNPAGRTVGVYDPTTNRLVAPGSPAGAAACSTCIAPLSPLVRVSGNQRQDKAEIGVPQQPSVDDTDGLTAILTYEMSDSMELKSMSAWRGVTAAQWDNSGGAHRTIYAPNARFSRYSLSDLHQSQFSQEVQATGSAADVDYVGGLYYFKENVEETAATPSSNIWNADGTAFTIASPIVTGAVTSANQGWAYGYRFLQRGSRATAKSYAAFAQATWHVMDTVHLTGGGRYTKDKRDGVLYLVSGVPTNYLFTFDKGRFDPMLTLGWDAADGVNLYAKYSTGYRAGGANSRSGTFASFGPETVDAYEAGAKMDLLNRMVRLNVAGYMMNRKGTQIDFDHVDTNPFLPGTTTPNPTFNLHTEETANAPGTSRIRGFEAELTVRPADGVTLGASYAYTHTNVPATPNPQLPGNPLTQVFVVFTPENALSGFADLETQIDTGGTVLRFHVDANYADEMYSFQNETTLTEGSFIVNANISLAGIMLDPQTGQELTLSLWSRNLLNEDHIYRRSNANNATLGGYANFNPPRTFGLEARISF